MLQPLTEQQWTNSFRAFVRHVSGNPRAQVNSQKYRWPKLIEVIEADPPDTPSPIGFTPAQVLNSAVVQKHTLRDVLGGFASISHPNKALVILKVGSRSAAAARAQQRQQSALQHQPPPLLLLVFVFGRLLHGIC
jgi:hypothetical protein